MGALKILVTEATGLLATTGFVLTKFSSNSKKVLGGLDQKSPNLFCSESHCSYFKDPRAKINSKAGGN